MTPATKDHDVKGPGVKPPQQGLLRREVIGSPECPILYRWTLLSTRLGKVMVHRFLPNADDRAEHDHPASFVTLVLAGGYDDFTPCWRCWGPGDDWPPTVASCTACGGTGFVVGDRLRRGGIRFRRAEYRHRTRVGPTGCWTIVLMGPKRREWGFWKEGRWWFWRDHERTFGFGMRCPEERT